MKNKLPYEATGSAIKGYRDSQIAKGEDNDCVVRAFASSFDVSYDYAHKYVAEVFKRKPRKGTFSTPSKLVRMADEQIVINGKKVYPVGNRLNSYMFGSLSYDVKVKGVIKRRSMTVGRFAKKYTKGSFFVLVRGHAFTIKDGVVIGNPEDAVKLKRPMRCAFEIK